MLQSRANSTAFLACQSFQRIIFEMVLKWNLHHHQLGYSMLVRQKQLRKALLLLLSVSDCKRVYTSLYFIITIFTRSVSLMWRSAMAWILQHLHYTQCLTNHGKLINHMFWSVSTKSWNRIVFLSCFVDLHWRISLAYTSKAWLIWKLLVLLSELGG